MSFDSLLSELNFKAAYGILACTWCRKELPKDAFALSYVNEAAFKQDYIRFLRRELNFMTVFEIENEEKEPGFPDIMSIHDITSPPVFFEIKITNKIGNFKMQKTQPLFYRKHPELLIYVIVWDSKNKKVWRIPAMTIVKYKKLMFNIDDFTDKVYKERILYEHE